MKITVTLIATGEVLKVDSLCFAKDGHLDFITIDTGRIIEPEQVEIRFETNESTL